MSNEAQIRVSLNIRTGKGDYRSQPTSFQADVSAFKGSTPGLISVAVAGTQVSFTQLTTPGLCWIQNLDPTNYVEWGIKDPATSKFFPIGEILPGEFYLIRFSRNLLSDYYNTGTGTDADVNYLWFKANVAACLIRVDAFEK